MERVSFLVERTGEAVGCLLNPESVSVTRHAGVRGTASVPRAQPRMDDELFSDGGWTEYRLELLFDVTIPGSSVRTDDVRVLTEPLRRLARASATAELPAFRRPPSVHFIWGTAWNVPGVVSAVAERQEAFDRTGRPRRSWMSMSFLEVPARRRAAETRRRPSVPRVQDVLRQAGADAGASSRQVRTITVTGGPSAGGVRLETVAHEQYGDSRYWRHLAAFNGIADPGAVPAGTVLRVPELTVLRS